MGSEAQRPAGLPLAWDEAVTRTDSKHRVSSGGLASALLPVEHALMSVDQRQLAGPPGDRSVHTGKFPAEDRPQQVRGDASPDGTARDLRHAMEAEGESRDPLEMYGRDGKSPDKIQALAAAVADEFYARLAKASPGATPAAPAAVSSSSSAAAAAPAAERPPLAPPDTPEVRALARVYDALLPSFVVKGDPERAELTARALAAAGVSPSTLIAAGWMAYVRDCLAQAASSLAGYGSSFVVFNSLLMHLTAPPDGSPSDAPHRPPGLLDITGATLGMVATSIPMQRALRLSEMLPGWTAPVQSVGEDRSAPPLDTAWGRFKVAAQYWPFLGSLFNATFNEDAVSGKLASRRLFGTFATLGVAAHRMFAFRRDLPWLNGRTAESTRIMQQHIHELTDVGSTLRAAAAYALRPLAGMSGLAGIDVLSPIENMARPMVRGGGGDLASAPDPLPPRRFAPGIDVLQPGRGDRWPEFAHYFRRAMCILVPMLLLEALNGNVAEATEDPRMRGALSDTFLVGLWGVGMLLNELWTREGPMVREEAAARAKRHAAFMDEKFKARHPPGPRPPDDDDGGAVL